MGLNGATSDFRGSGCGRGGGSHVNHCFGTNIGAIPAPVPPEAVDFVTLWIPRGSYTNPCASPPPQILQILRIAQKTKVDKNPWISDVSCEIP